MSVCHQTTWGYLYQIKIIEQKGLALLFQFRRAIGTARGFERDGSEAARALFRCWHNRRSRLFHAIQSADEHEDHEGNDQEVYDRLDEQAVSDLSASNNNGQTTKIDAAH